MSTLPKDEQDDNFCLKKALDHVAFCRTAESEARAKLFASVEGTKRAKEKYEALFAQCEERAVARRKSGQVVVNPGY